ncbi:MAG: tetratricopeptide repeat protein, partial [Phycisphaerales bacterium]|nr:tetratricopeptide repeat protein [Phycisphaerales bacterium]
FARVELAELEAGAGGHDAAVALLEPIAERADLPGDLGERSGYRLGACLYELGRDEAAARAFEAFLKSHAKSSLAPSARLLAGEAHFRRGQHRQAAAHLARAAESEEARLRAPALLRLGEAHAALQAWKESEQAFSRFLREFPESEVWFQARFGLGFAMENQGRFDEAITSYRAVIEKHDGPTAARSQFQIGECLYAQTKYDEAARELLKVDILYAYPEWSAAALYEAGRGFEAMAQVGQARQQFEAVRDQHAGTRWAELATARLAALSKPDLPGRGGGSGGGR